jgi:hypothetical protein
MDGVIRDDGITHELEKGSGGVERQTFLEIGRQTLHETCLLLVIGVDLFWRIQCQMVEQLGVVIGVNRNKVIEKPITSINPPFQ